MIIPILKNFNNIFIKEDSFFIDLFNIDDNFYYFNVYFDFHVKNVLENNVLNFDFEIVDTSKILSEDFINLELKKQNLPSIDEKNEEYQEKKELIDKLILNLKTDYSVVFFKKINITKSINNLNKSNTKIIQKRNKININDEIKLIKNFNYKQLYIKSGEFKFNDFKKNIENDFLFSTNQYISEFITHKELIKIDKSIFTSNLLSFNLKVENDGSYKNINKIINISDIIGFITNKSIINYKIDNYELVLDNKLKSKIKVLKTNLLTNKSTVIINHNDDKIKINNDEKESNVYTIIRDNFDNINYSIDEFSIVNNNINNKINILCYNVYDGIYIKVNNKYNGSFIIKKRDLSDKNSEFKQIFVDLDTDVKTYHVYEYAIFDQNDNKNYLANFVIDRPNIKFNDQQFDIKSDVNNDDVKFNISYLKDNENFISILKTFDLYDQYQDLLINNNQDIKNIFYYKIDRYNDDTGEFYNLGWTNDSFSDFKFSKKNLKPQRNKDFNYTYFITAYNVLSIMFLKEEKQILNGSNNRKYLFDKNKWIHPLLIEKSISSSKDTRNSLFGKNEFEYGFASEVIILNINKKNEITNDNFSITNLNTNRKYKNYIVLEWNAENINNINHLIVTKTNNSLYEEIVDKISIKSGKNLYFYDIKNDDMKVILNIYPVLNNFKIKEKYSFEEIEI